MSFIEYLICPLKDTVDEVVNLIHQVYGKRDLAIETTLADFFDLLKDELYSFVEYPYVDRIYRDSYYSYFSSKHNDYHRDCIRIALFEGSITAKDFRSHRSVPSLQAAFRGFIIIRPTFPSIIGRTLIDPRALKKKDFQICNCATGVSVNGIKLSVSGFPFSAQ